MSFIILRTEVTLLTTVCGRCVVGNVTISEALKHTMKVCLWVLNCVLLYTAFHMQTWFSMWNAGGRGEMKIRSSAPGWPAWLRQDLLKEAVPEQGERWLFWCFVTPKQRCPKFVHSSPRLVSFKLLPILSLFKLCGR